MTPGQAQAVPKPDDLIADKYQLESQIGEGSMGLVFLARHVVTGKRVAVKWLRGSAEDPEAVHRLRREARAAARVRHLNVVDVYDVGTWRGGLFLVMELLEGETLDSHMLAGPMPAAEVLQLMMPVMRAVAAAHRAGVVHRDLKPANIFLAQHDDDAVLPKVLDFGVSKLYRRGEHSEEWTTDSSTVGTPLYMAPEQFLDAGNSDARADIYSLAVILYEALSGCRPFEADNRDALMVKVATESPVPLAARNTDLPPALIAAVTKGMARKPADRFEDVGAFIDAVENAALAGTPLQSSVVPRAARPSTGIRGYAVAALVVSLGVVGVLVLWPQLTHLALAPAQAPTSTRGPAPPPVARQPEPAPSAAPTSTHQADVEPPPPAAQAEPEPLPAPPTPRAKQAAKPRPARRRALSAPAEPSAPPPAEAAQPAAGVIKLRLDDF